VAEPILASDRAPPTTNPQRAGSTVALESAFTGRSYHPRQHPDPGQQAYALVPSVRDFIPGRRGKAFRSHRTLRRHGLLWPRPDEDPDINLNEVAGAEWIDDAGRTARYRLRVGDPEESEFVVGHCDWLAGNLRWNGDALSWWCMTGTA
jgi:hypothetical protein